MSPAPTPPLPPSACWRRCGDGAGECFHPAFAMLEAQANPPCRGLPMSDTPVTIPALQQMKRDGKKSVGVVAWDYQIARIAERAGVDFVSVGDSVGVNLWGHSNPLEVTLDEILVCCKAVRRGVTRALVSCDVPFGPVQEGVEGALRAAIRLVKEGGADMVKLDAAAEFPDAVTALTRAG